MLAQGWNSKWVWEWQACQITPFLDRVDALLCTSAANMK